VSNPNKPLELDYNEKLKLQTKWPKFCITCQKMVPHLDHRRHEHILDCIIRADVPGCDNLFVHCRGDEITNFDEDGAPVVCDHCFIAELEDLKGTPLFRK
jgi:hypothetical protein